MNKPKDDLFATISKLLDRHPVDDVIPILITASARALIIDADGDLPALNKKFARFCGILQGQMLEMMVEDLDESARSTKQ